jgi:SnoaL-like domain
MTRKVSEFATELADREAIRDCLMRFSRAIDRIDVALGSNLYWPEGTDDHGSLFRGSWSEYFAFAEKLLSGMEATQHFIGNILIEIDGNEASVESYVLAYHGLTSNGCKTNYIGGARYLDKLHKRDDEWRVLNRVLVIDWMKNIPDDPRWTSDLVGGHFIAGARKPDDKSMRHFKRLGHSPSG